MECDVKEIGGVPVKVKVLRAIWNIVWLFFFRPFGTKLFNPWRLSLLKMFGAKVCGDSGVYASVRIWAPWNLVMGHNAWLGPDVICYNQDVVTLEDNVTVSQYSFLCTAGHKLDEVNSHSSGLIVAPITIRANAWVGAKAYIGMGVTLGEWSVVGATASVYKDVAPWTVVGGNPAKLLKVREILNPV